jgi:hypothetical protein
MLILRSGINSQGRRRNLSRPRLILRLQIPLDATTLGSFFLFFFSTRYHDTRFPPPLDVVVQKAPSCVMTRQTAPRALPCRMHAFFTGTRTHGQFFDTGTISGRCREAVGNRARSSPVGVREERASSCSCLDRSIARSVSSATMWESHILSLPSVSLNPPSPISHLGRISIQNVRSKR